MLAVWDSPRALRHLGHGAGAKHSPSGARGLRTHLAKWAEASQFGPVETVASISVAQKIEQFKCFMLKTCFPAVSVEHLNYFQCQFNEIYRTIC